MRKIYLLGYYLPSPVEVYWAMNTDYQSARAAKVSKKGEKTENKKSTVFLYNCGYECGQDDVMILLG